MADNLISESIYYKIEFNVFLPFSCGNLDYISVLPEQDHFKKSTDIFHDALFLFFLHTISLLRITTY